MPDGQMGPYATYRGTTLGARIGITDQFLRVWRLFMFNQQSALSMLGTELVGVITGYNEDAFTSEVVTGQYPGAMIHAAGLRIHFTVTQAINPTPNTAEITIYNLDDSKQNMLIHESNYVILQAGYLYGQAGTIFTGNIKMFKRGHENATDSYLKMYCADCDKVINGATVNFMVKAGTPPLDQLNQMYKTMEPYNVQVGRIDPKAIIQPSTKRDAVLYGMTADAMTDFARVNTAIWHILNNRFYFTKPTSYEPNSIVVLTGTTGLIGFPEMTQDGINVTCLINPAIQLRQRIKLDNKSINQYLQPATVKADGSTSAGGQAGGLFNWPNLNTNIYYYPTQQDGIYVPVSINVEGDSRGTPWYQYMICLGVDESVDPISAVFGAMDWSWIR